MTKPEHTKHDRELLRQVVAVRKALLTVCHKIDQFQRASYAAATLPRRNKANWPERLLAGRRYRLAKLMLSQVEIARELSGELPGVRWELQGVVRKQQLKSGDAPSPAGTLKRPRFTSDQPSVQALPRRRRKRVPTVAWHPAL